MAFGILNPDKKTADDGKDAFLFRMEIPKFLSLLAERDSKAFVPGINDLLKGGYPLKDGTTALSAQEKIEKGKTAIGLSPLIVPPKLRATMPRRRWLPKC